MDEDGFWFVSSRLKDTPTTPTAPPGCATKPEIQPCVLQVLCGPGVWPPLGYSTVTTTRPTTQPGQTKANKHSQRAVAREKLLSCTRSCHSLRRVPGRDKEEAECGTRVKEETRRQNCEARPTLLILLLFATSELA